MHPIANLLRLRRRIDRSSRHVVRILQAHQRRLRIVVNHWPDGRLDLFPRQDSVFPAHGPRHAPRNRRHGRQLVQIYVAAFLANHFIPMMRPNLDRDQVPHAARRNEQRRFFPKNFRRAFLQPVDRRIFSVHVVPDLRLRHRPSHLRCRPRHRVAPQVDDPFHSLHVVRIAPHSRLCDCRAHVSISLCSVTAAIPQTLHSKYSTAPAQVAPRRHPSLPIPPTPAAQTAPPNSPHTPARSAKRRSRPVAAARETALPPAPASPSPPPVARPALAHSAARSHKPPHRARSPIAPSPKTNALPRQIPGTAPAASISNCAAIRTPAFPNSKFRSGDIPSWTKIPAPFHKNPPSHLRSAAPRRCIVPRPAALPFPAGFLHQSPAGKPTRAPAQARPIPRAIAASFLSSGAANPQSNRS